jgi:hypothetical protein
LLRQSNAENSSNLKSLCHGFLWLNNSETKMLPEAKVLLWSSVLLTRVLH